MCLFKLPFLEERDKSPSIVTCSHTLTANALTRLQSSAVTANGLLNCVSELSIIFVKVKTLYFEFHFIYRTEIHAYVHISTI